jgi:hypothetical protein
MATHFKTEKGHLHIKFNFSLDNGFIPFYNYFVATL